MATKTFYISPDRRKHNEHPRSVVIDNKRYINPRAEVLVRAGWSISVEDVPDTSYEERVVSLIRERYSINDELAILRQRDTKPEEFAEYNAYCELCKKNSNKEQQD